MTSSYKKNVSIKILCDITPYLSGHIQCVAADSDLVIEGETLPDVAV